MKSRQIKLSSLFPSYFILLTGLGALSASAATLYVNVNNAVPSPPYSTWDTAATNIQDAVDVAVAGDEIAVTNGVYQSGQRVWPQGEGTNRLAITKPLNVHSMNGADVTIIDGGGQFRCAYLVADATLSGLTLSNGFAGPRVYGIATTGKGGGVYCESNSAVVSDCVITGNSTPWYDGSGGGAYGGTLKDCIVTSNKSPVGSEGGGAANAILNDCLVGTNFAFNGGGAINCTLNNSTLLSNGGADGGGAAACTLNNCYLAYNSVDDFGGGAYGSTLNNCTLVSNHADRGAGASGGILNNCILRNNGGALSGGGAQNAILNNCTISQSSAIAAGGGLLGCTANNCLLINNRAYNSPYGAYGGGASGGTLNNCTLIANQSNGTGGGATYATLNNCIVYYNTALQDPNYDTNCILNYCCTTPMPTNGVGNFTNEPVFVDLPSGNFRLQPGSPCINAGNNAYVTNSTDLDGNPRISGGTVDVGAYEFVFARQLYSSRLSGTDYCFSFDTESNRTYTVEYKNALTDPAWSSYPPIIGNGQMATFTNSAPGTPQRFYRLRAD